MKTFAYIALAIVLAGCFVVLLGESDDIVWLLVSKSAALAVAAVCCHAWKGVRDFELD